MKYQKHIPPCNGDCFNCARPASKCAGNKKEACKSPYVDGTRPLDHIKSNDFGGIKLIGSKIFFKK